jgi:hypothetical protein
MIWKVREAGVFFFFWSGTDEVLIGFRGEFQGDQ